MKSFLQTKECPKDDQWRRKSGPMKAMLQNPHFIRSVPIGISKSYDHGIESFHERSIGKKISHEEKEQAMQDPLIEDGNALE